jgi:hypothetical protein
MRRAQAVTKISQTTIDETYIVCGTRFVNLRFFHVYNLDLLVVGCRIAAVRFK